MIFFQPYSLRNFSTLFSNKRLAVRTCLTSQFALEISVSAFSVWNQEDSLHSPGSYVGPGAPNSCSHVWIASSLITKQSSQHNIYILIGSSCCLFIKKKVFTGRTIETLMQCSFTLCINSLKLLGGEAVIYFMYSMRLVQKYRLIFLKIYYKNNFNLICMWSFSKIAANRI